MVHDEVPVEPIQASDEVHVSVVQDDATTKSNEEVAREVIAGMWGRGQMRATRLREAGYDPKAIKAEIDRIFGRA